MAQSPPALTFDTASITVNRSGAQSTEPPPRGTYSAVNFSLGMLIRAAYQVTPPETVGGPSWIDAERFNVRATFAGDRSPAEQSLMLRVLLAERFHLLVHSETRTLHYYRMVLAHEGQPGPNLVPSIRDCATEPPATPESLNEARDTFTPPCGWGFVLANQIAANTQEIWKLTGTLSRNPDVNRLVVDETGLPGTFSYYLTWRPLPGQLAPPHDPALDEPSIFTALEDQLGLTLVSVDGPREVLIVDHAEPPMPD